MGDGAFVFLWKLLKYISCSHGYLRYLLTKYILMLYNMPMKKITLLVVSSLFFIGISLISAEACATCGYCYTCHYEAPRVNHLPNFGVSLTSVHTPVYYGNYDRNPDTGSNYYNVNSSNNSYYWNNTSSNSYYWNTNTNNDYYWYYNNQNQNTCSNTVPVFSNFNPVRVAREGSVYTSYALASSSGDKVTYRFITAPDGMTIDPSTGLISWTPNYSQGRAAAYTVTVAAANCFREIQTTYYLVVSDVQFALPVPQPVYVPIVYSPIYEPEVEVECDPCGCDNIANSCNSCGVNGGMVVNNGSNSNLNVGDQTSLNLVNSLGGFISTILAFVFSSSFLILIILILIYNGWKSGRL